MSKHVVVGAGPVGTATALLLAGQGHDVVVVTRTGSGPDHPAITRLAADASSAAALAGPASGAAALYNCASPAYHRWPTLWPPLAAALLETAERTGAVLATVSNLYPYGPVGGPITEDLPLAATGPKARTRTQMWLDALASHEAGRSRVTEVRASSYVCPGPNSPLGDRVVPFALAGKPVSVMPSADMPHTWTSVDDVARLLVTVAGEERAWGRAWHVPSNAPRTQREAVADLCRVAGVPPVEVREYPAVVLAVLQRVHPAVREMREVQYQLRAPFVLDSSAARQAFGLAPTPWDEVLGRLVEHYRTPVPAA